MLANSFYPSVDSGFGYDRKDVSLPARPQTIGPVLDPLRSTEPLASFDARQHAQSYAFGKQDDGTSKMPPKPEGFSDPYLYPMLTREERLRLTMLWYYTRDLVHDQKILQKIQAKVDLLKSLVGWEFAICGLLENDIFHRLAVAGLPLAILPRRESTCSHTVQQPAGSVFFIPDMSSDWRFAQSPHVSEGGLSSYAGAQLRCQVDNGAEVALGSLCIASNTPNRTLTPSQLDLLVDFADMLTDDIINTSRRKRAKQQEFNDILLREAFTESLGNPTNVAIMRILNQVFPEAQISLLPVSGDIVQLHAGGPPIVLPELHVKSAIWEDSNFIDDLLQTNNHERLNATRPIRAIIGIVLEKPDNQALVVSTTDITRIFDDVDVRFVEGCAMILRGIAQEKSLQDAVKAREQFMRGITHQLRTPIHGILGSVDLLADEVARADQHERAAESTNNIVHENLKMIKSSGRELMSTVNNVIKFNRWAESFTNARPATLNDLNKLESEILEDVSWLLPEGRLDNISIFFNNTLPVEVGIIQIDTTLLKDCLQSMVLNALQNTTRGSVVITMSTAPDYSSILFDVEDTGCGVAPADRDRIFDAYEKGNAHSTGAGLGLTIARKIAKSLSGSVTLISSVLEKGSHFRAEFRNPGFACPKDNARAAISVTSDLPERFAFIPSDPPSTLDNHFVNFLKARGLQLSDDVKGPLAIVSFTHLTDQYQELLRLAEKSLVAISLVPAGEDLAQAKEIHPQVLFFSGPFTSDRLIEILSETKDTYVSCRPTPITEQPSSSEVDAEARPAVALDLPSLSISSRRSSTIPQNSIPNCLLVDDNLINLRIMSMYCDKRKFPYITAVDGLQAIDKYKNAVKESPITLILLDLQMPNCDGIQACEEIRAFEVEEHLSPAVIFIVTGQDSASDKTKSLAAGADKFFVKPLALKSLDRGIVEVFYNKAIES